MVIASVAAWGLGDAAAALVGKRFGKHHIENGLRAAEPEGTIYVCDVLFSVLIVLLANGSLRSGYLRFVVTAAVSVLWNRTGRRMDTITCPLAAVRSNSMVYLWGSLR